MKLKKIATGEYEGQEEKDGYIVTCNASAQSYNGFSYSVYVNNCLVDGDGYTGFRLKDIKLNASSYMVDTAIEDYNNRI